MPYIVQGEQDRNEQSIYDKDKFDYNYPNGLDLQPTSDLHKLIVSRINRRANASRLEMSKRFPSWREIDQTLTTYIPTKELEACREAKDSTKPIPIVFPYSYSVLESLLTYLVMAFFQDPMFQYEGVDDTDIYGAMLMELVIKLHCIKHKVPLAVHTVLRDSLTYGIGVGVPGWEITRGKRPITSTIITQSPFGNKPQSVTNFVEDILFEGNTLYNIDPYMYLPDPSVSSDNIQTGEFNGWLERDNFMNLLAKESEEASGLFNVKYLKSKQNKRSILALDQSDREKKYGGGDKVLRGMSGITNPVDVIKMYVTIIPKDWKLSSSEAPEKWYFEVAADDLLISCQKADHNHGMYPISVASPEFDGHTITPIGRLEVLYGLQHTLDFLFNSHINNVKKAINDMLIVDPWLVNINDLKKPSPGKLIRLRRPAWGRGVDKVVQQLAVQDITRANISDGMYITQWMDRISGADQSMQGALRQGGPERLTKGEFQGTRSSAISRLQRIAMIVGIQFMQDIGTMFAVHTQQYMQKEMFVKISGRYAEQLKGQFGPAARKKVSPEDIMIDYDLIVRDGSIPGGNFSEAWVELFNIMSRSPELMQQFDMVRIFSYIATQLGAKNVEDFKRMTENMQPQTMPDQTVADQAAAGNLVPMQGI